VGEGWPPLCPREIFGLRLWIHSPRTASLSAARPASGLTAGTAVAPRMLARIVMMERVVGRIVFFVFGGGYGGSDGEYDLFLFR
jgi:hypothetical protein